MTRTQTFFLFVGLLLALLPRPVFVADFIRADSNGDGEVNVADPVRTLTVLFRPDTLAELPTCWKALDANDDGEIDVSDPVFTLLSLFSSPFPDPSPPFPDCGADPTEDAISCEHTSCEAGNGVTSRGPVLHYDFSEGRGTELTDRSGHGNHGVIVGAEWTGELGATALEFDGVDDHVEIPPSPSLERLDQEFTIELRVNPAENPPADGLGAYRLLLGRSGEFWDPESSFGLYLLAGGTSLVGYVRHGPTASAEENDVYRVIASTKGVNRWQDVVLTRTRSQLILYVDSEPVFKTYAPELTIPSFAGLRIGGIQGRFFAGSIRELRVFDYARTPGLVLDYDFSVGSGETLYDLSGNENHGRIHGAVWTQGRAGPTLRFDGQDDYVEVLPSSSLHELRDEFTIEMLVKPGPNPPQPGSGLYGLLMGRDGSFSSPESAFGLYANQGGQVMTGYVRYGPGTAPNEVYEVHAPKTNSDGWRRITFVKEREELSLYVDSSPLDVDRPEPTDSVSTPEAVVATDLPLRIGGVDGHFFQGEIKSIRVFDFARRRPFIMMVTSWDERISSTPLLDIAPEEIEILDTSPFDAVALNLVDIYSAQPLPNAGEVLERAGELRDASRKEVWVRVNLNRMFERCPGNYYWDGDATMEDVEALPTRGASIADVRFQSTPYFAAINVMDLFDDVGARTDFYATLELALKFSAVAGGGIALDLENYGGCNDAEGNGSPYHLDALARAYQISLAEVITALERVGADMADIIAREHPAVTLLALFTHLNQPNWDGEGHYVSVAYVARGLLQRVRDLALPCRIIDGGEGAATLGYINPTLGGLLDKISRRWISTGPVLDRFAPRFELGGTVTVWDDPGECVGWCQELAGEPNPFQSLRDFQPFLREILSSYDFLWFYAPALTDYAPFSESAPAFHQRLAESLNQVLRRDEVVAQYEFKEGEGSRLVDLSGHGNEGVIQGARWVVEGGIHALSFDGEDDQVLIADSPSLQNLLLGREFTIEALLRPGPNPPRADFGSYRLIVGKSGEFWDPESAIALYANEGGGGFTGAYRYGPEASVERNDVYRVEAEAAPVGTWQEVMLVKDRGEFRIYVDSLEPAATVAVSQTGIGSTHDCVIGGVAGRFFEGAIGRLTLYGYAVRYPRP